ncbi:MAG: hypothetical protein Q7R76_01040 [Candidatus Woesearchaeota archaeon]|nr:hypothetical protein [Candidatus Woesearchaeota archaeon]
MPEPDAHAGPNVLDYLVEEALTPELKAQFTRLGEDWLDMDKQSRVTTELGERLNRAYEHTAHGMAGLHEGKDYAEDFGKESFKVAKRLFENDKTDYIHDRKQAKETVTKFMLNILHEMGTSTAHAIAHTYDHTEGSRTDEERFEYLKTAFNSELGVGGRGDDDEGSVNIDGLIARMTGSHRAKQTLLDAATKLKSKYAGVVASKKLNSVVTEGKKAAYKAFVEELAGTQNLHPSHAKTAFHETPQWAGIHSDLYNFVTYQQPYQVAHKLGMEPGHGHN